MMFCIVGDADNVAKLLSVILQVKVMKTTEERRAELEIQNAPEDKKR